MLKKLTIEFIRKSFEKEKYRLLTDEYINTFQKLKYICPNGHRHSIVWGHWQQGKRCPYCAGVAKKTIEDIRRSFKKEKYILLSDVYINAHTKLEYICPNNHRRYITWSNWNSGYRCLMCFYENHPSWKGGISKLPYCPEWSESYKEEIKERDGYQCLNPYCYHTSDRLAVHHIDYTKTLCGPDNLITVCNSCNSYANKNREWHTQWYRIILNKRYGYKY